MGATSSTNIAAKPSHPPVVGGSKDMTAQEAITAAIKKIPVTYTGGVFTVPSGFNCRAISYNDETAGYAINLKLVNDDSADVVWLAPRILHPCNVDTITQASTTAVGLFVWG